MTNSLAIPWGSDKHPIKEIVTKFTKASVTKSRVASQHSPQWMDALNELGDSIRELRLSLGEERYTFAQKIEIDELDLAVIENGYASLEQLLLVVPRIDALYKSDLATQLQHLITNEKTESTSPTDVT